MIPVSLLCQIPEVCPRNSTLCYRPGLGFLWVDGMNLPSTELPRSALCSSLGRRRLEVPFNRVATKQLPLTLANLQQ